MLVFIEWRRRRTGQVGEGSFAADEAGGGHGGDGLGCRGAKASAGGVADERGHCQSVNFVINCDAWVMDNRVGMPGGDRVWRELEGMMSSKNNGSSRLSNVTATGTAGRCHCRIAELLRACGIGTGSSGGWSSGSSACRHWTCPLKSE